jgi:hypothetical protein
MRDASDNDLIERLAREAGIGVVQEDGTIHVMGNECDGELRRFAAAEECAKVADARGVYYRRDDDGPRGADDPNGVKSRRTTACDSCAAAIRAKFQRPA